LDAAVAASEDVLEDSADGVGVPALELLWSLAPPTVFADGS
jgi:hypothetical protein